MRGLDPRIHVLAKTKGVDGRIKSGHDVAVKQSPLLIGPLALLLILDPLALVWRREGR